MDNLTAMDRRVQKVYSKGIGHRMWKARNGYLFLLPVFWVMGIFKYYPAAKRWLCRFSNGMDIITVCSSDWATSSRCGVTTTLWIRLRTCGSLRGYG